MIFETTGDGEIMTAEKDVSNVRANRGGLENSRRDKADVSVRTVAGERWVPQSYID